MNTSNRNGRNGRGGDPHDETDYPDIQPRHPGVTTDSIDAWVAGGEAGDAAGAVGYGDQSDSNGWSEQPTAPQPTARPADPQWRAGGAGWRGELGRAPNAAFLNPDELREALRYIVELRHHLQSRIGGRVFGMELVVDMLLTALLAGAHVLIEGDPGLGKTSLVEAFARSLQLRYSRIQCTPDKLPSEATGYTMPLDYSGGGALQDRLLNHPPFHPGPVFANIVHVDEVNRASGYFQSGLLEAMAEGHVTTDDGETLDLPRPNLFVATQNPYDEVGTNHLPASQRDRFGLGLKISYPSPEVLHRIIAEAPGLQDAPPAHPVPHAGATEVLTYRRAVALLPFSTEIPEYMTRMIYKFAALYVRPDGPEQGLLAQPPSPRAGQEWLRICQAAAALRGDTEVRPSHLQEFAVPVLAHRLILLTHANQRPEALVERVLDETPAPSEQPGASHLARGRR